ncbi:S1C family serine protease [Planococcus sp. X10-3]|uniref:S1C family serine protease n=1 Tax=Planococcus sp. X10-3 TaxID=3061240 RepID=UPI003BAFA668
MKSKNKKPKKRRVLGTLAALLLLAGGGYSLQQFGDGDSAQSSVAAEAEEKPSAEAPVKEGEPGEKPKTELIKETQQKVYTVLTDSGMGSGFLYNEFGMVVTNAHVVVGHTDVMLRNVDGKEFAGKVIGISDVEDIALIHVEAFEDEAPLVTEMEATAVGTEVIALGSPNGFENTASIGYLTGVDRDFSSDYQYEDIYQVDAQIAPGSSGGPLIDAESGRVIGINSLLYNDGNAIGFSIPLYSVTDSLDAWAEDPMEN